MTAAYQQSAWECAQALQARELSSRELVESVFSRIDQVEGDVHAYETLLRERALKQAVAIDEKRAAGEDLPGFAGVPVALKDNLCYQGTTCTCSSKMLENFVPPYDATVVQKCLDAGLIPVGKTVMDEFAMGSSTEHAFRGRSNNPWNLDCVPGGSSGGSAAAVIAEEAPFALGSDTGGSIRQPAAFCSVVGMKPTYGRVSRYGLVAFASSLDQIGPFARNAKDAAALLEIISGHDPMDSTSIEQDVPNYMSELTGDLKGLRVGIPEEYFPDGLNGEVKSTVEAAIREMEAAGAECKPVSLPHTEYAIATYYIICTAEASSNLARYDGVVFGHRTEKPIENLVDMYMKSRSEGFGAEVKRRIILGTYVLSAGFFDAYYRRAQKVRTLIKRDFDTAFKDVDVVVGPATPTPPFKAGEKTGDPLEMYLSDVFTAPVNMAGLPGVVIPAGFSSEGLPIGLQLVGPVLSEGKLLNVAHAFQQLTDHHNKRPSL